MNNLQSPVVCSFVCLLYRSSFFPSCLHLPKIHKSFLSSPLPTRFVLNQKFTLFAVLKPFARKLPIQNGLLDGSEGRKRRVISSWNMRSLFSLHRRNDCWRDQIEHALLLDHLVIVQDLSFSLTHELFTGIKFWLLGRWLNFLRDGGRGTLSKGCRKRWDRDGNG